MPEELKQMSTVGHTYTTYTTRHVKHGGTHDFEKKIESERTNLIHVQGTYALLRRMWWYSRLRKKKYESNSTKLYHVQGTYALLRRMWWYSRLRKKKFRIRKYQQNVRATT